MPTDKLVLYTDGFWISPYVFTAFVALREKKLAFETVTVPLQDRAQRAPEYAEKSVTARVPSLDHRRRAGRYGAFRLAESSAIVEYLEEVFPPPKHPRLFPEGVRERARARQLLAWIRSDLDALRAERPTTTMFYERAKEPLTQAGKDAADKLLRVANLLVPEAGTPLFGAWSIADADLAFMLHRLILNGHEVPPKVRKFAEAQWQRPSVRVFVDRERPPYAPYG